MKRVLLVALLALTCGMASAQAADVKAGLEPRAVVQALGEPLMVSKSKSGAQMTWTYDRGGYVMFERGRVTFYQPSKSKR